MLAPSLNLKCLQLTTHTRNLYYTYRSHTLHTLGCTVVSYININVSLLYVVPHLRNHFEHTLRCVFLIFKLCRKNRIPLFIVSPLLHLGRPITLFGFFYLFVESCIWRCYYTVFVVVTVNVARVIHLLESFYEKMTKNVCELFNVHRVHPIRI